ncbi:allene oxide synthase-lipoxygenase protein-like [Corticium candelabrum]|uniref:allene oxide synthase-lipoxygenase protein-like n=1 Tax=Corticium candelabrum TaxID=121492 RepID=UPI002E33BD1E|nr:allene oxide synthase-lipoxygenase protein-like [Corticium candelabrum]
MACALPPGQWYNKASEELEKMVGQNEAKRLRENEFPNLPCAMFLANQEHLKLKGNAIWTKNYEASLKCGRRSTNMAGVGGFGTLTVARNGQFPPNEIFNPGSVYPLRLRHSNALGTDDRAMDILGVAIKLADVDEGGPLDLPFSSGEGLLYCNGPALDDLFQGPLSGDLEKYKAYLKKNGSYYRNLVNMMRRGPSSYDQVHYYAQLTYKYCGLDGIQRHCRYRIVPANDGPESGLLDDEDQKFPWNGGPRPTDTRSPNYLKQEFASRLEKETIEYRLQIQIRNREGSDDKEISRTSR